MQLRKLEKSNPKAIRQFKRLPFRLYAGNRFWVPPIPGEIEQVMSPEKHPFYSHSEADFFVVEQEREILGRIAVLHNRHYCEYHHSKTAFFYYFESVNDTEVSRMLFNGAETWCRERGLESIIGPKGFLRTQGPGMLVEGFDQLPALGIPYNLPYYPALVEDAGFVKSHEHFSGYMEKHPNGTIHLIAEKVLSRGNFEVRSFHDVREILEWIPVVDEVQQKAFSDNPNFYPHSKEEFDLLAKNILALADPKFLKLILHDEKVAGFIVAYPNINRSLQRCKGRLFPFGWLSLRNEKNHPVILDINGVGLLPDYQGLGGNALLYSELDKVIHSTHIRKAEIVQVDERNLRSYADMQKMGVVFSKTHRTYRKTL
jgi:hypothetical protein